MLKKYAAIPFAVMCLTSQLAFAEETKSLSSVVITATKTEQDSFDLPMSIDKVSKEQIQDGQLRMTLSESLARVPGITAQNRTQMAQDPQISSRGFGARSAFGVRGIRVYVDGIPLSMPDGIGNPGSVDLGMMESIEVMRGPFSAMYGNSSGGVIQMFTENAPKTPEVSGDLLAGSYGTYTQSVKAAGATSGVDYVLGYSNFKSDGYREQSASTKKQATAKLKTTIGDDSKLTTLLSWFDQDAKDPGGLLVSEARTAASPTSKTVNSRVARGNTQIGINFEKSLNATNTLNLLAYAGQRDNNQILYVANIPTYNSRASVIDRDFMGTELRWSHKGQVSDMPYSISSGVTYSQMVDDRKDINADSGVARAAITANFNRNEKQTATTSDQYVQGSLTVTPQIDLHAGVRRTNLSLKFEDELVGTSTQCSTAATVRLCDTSGSVRYTKTTPVIGGIYKLNPAVNLYVNAGQAFETPTLVESSFSNATTGIGPNLTLKPSTSNNYEAGVKAFLDDNTKVNATVFQVDTKNEIIVNSTVSGRTSYQNGKSTKRTGTELSIDALLPMNFSAYASYTLLDATFNENFSTTVLKGNRIPGTYKTQAFAELAWSYPVWGFQTALNLVNSSSVEVDDANTAGTAAAGYTIFNLRASLNQKSGPWSTTEYITLNNLTDVKYIGSIKVNDSNSRSYEPAAPFNWILGVKAAYKF
ncbi:CirA Outer membrane receptor proteins, mostly Fe transport [Burkholderiaceae bacterium]